jgi:hypothetical protein
MLLRVHCVDAMSGLYFDRHKSKTVQQHIAERVSLLPVHTGVAAGGKLSSRWKIPLVELGLSLHLASLHTPAFVRDHVLGRSDVTTLPSN